MKTGKIESRPSPAKKVGNDYWKNLTEKLDEIVLVWDKKCRLLMCNKRATELLGYSREEILDLKPEHILPDDCINLDTFYNNIQVDKEINLKTNCLNKEGQTVPARIRVFKMPFKGREAMITLVRCLAPYQKSEELLKEYANKLANQRIKIKRMEKVIRGLIKFIPKEHHRVKKQIQLAIEQLLLPLLERLKAEFVNPMKDTFNVNRMTVELLEKTINQFTTVYGGKAADRLLKLTQKELEICNLIRQGFATKEIAGYLNLSRRTVENHRNNICKKLGLVENKVKLSNYLKNLVLKS